MKTKARQKFEGWYARKPYPHFDLPLPFPEAKALVTDPNQVSRHSFWPFIAYDDVNRRFHPKKAVKSSTKIRPIKYCAHRDGYIHSYYAMKLGKLYESAISTAPFNDSVLGYRPRLGTNINFASDAFEEIQTRSECLAIALDISDFFGTIDHAVLKLRLEEVIGVKRLSDDWHKLFRCMTNSAWVRIEKIHSLTGKHGKSLPRPLLTAKQFREAREKDKGFVERNPKPYGIPQGSPISALLSNVYMLEFDKGCFEDFSKIGASYRRYSDDILVIGPPRCLPEVSAIIDNNLRRLGGSIAINTGKTEVCQYWRRPTGTLACDNALTYLGFTFDGNDIRLRDRTVSRYFRRMTYAARGANRSAEKSGAKTIFKRKLFTQFTHLGRANFYSYAKKARKITGHDGPTQQLRRHFKILQRKIKNRGK